MTIDYPNHEILFVPYEDATFVKDLFSIGLNLGKGENNAIIVDGLWAGGPSDKAGIKVGEEIIACNGRPFNADTIFQLRQLISDKTVKEVNDPAASRGASRAQLQSKLRRPVLQFPVTHDISPDHFTRHPVSDRPGKISVLP
jgi:S1-C subfamily serine protease